MRKRGASPDAAQNETPNAASNPVPNASPTPIGSDTLNSAPISATPVALPVPLSDIGEGPIWDERAGRLLWVDIRQASIHAFCPESGRTETIRAPEKISALLPCANGRWIAAAYHSLYDWSGEGESFGEILRLERIPAHVRFNDGKVGPDGGIWIGTMDMNGGTDGCLYRIDKALAWEEKIGGIGCSNGLDWSPDGSEMHYVDSAIREIRAFAFDSQSGSLGAKRIIVRLEDEAGGVFDGMTVDRDGMLWAAQWGGSRVARWNPADGSLLAEIRLPAPQPSSCVFGGDDYGTLYITSACEGMSREARAAFPLAGALFRLDSSRLGIRGRKPFSFG